MWLGTEKNGLLYAEQSARLALAIPLKTNNFNTITEYSVNAVLPDEQDNVWFLVKDIGLCYYKFGQKEAEIIDKSVNGGTCLSSASDNNLWIGTNSGLWSFSKTGRKSSKIEYGKNAIANSRIMSVVPEGNSKLWVSTDGDGVVVIDTKSKTVIQVLKQGEEDSIFSNAVYTIYIDAEHRKWIGTMRGGVNCIDPQRNLFKTYKHQPYNQNSLAHNVVMSFCEDGDNIWVGTDGKGISVWNKFNGNFKQYKFDVSDKFSSGANQITNILKDNDRFLFIASYGAGVKRFDKTNGTFKNIPFQQPDKSSKYVWRLFKDSENNIWAGCLKGRWAGELPQSLFRYNRQAERFEPSVYPIAGEVLSIAEDKKGNLWLGTLSEVIQINRRKNSCIKFKTDTYVRDIYIHTDSAVWIATNDKGLWNFNPFTHKFKIYNEANGLANNTVVSIEQDAKGYIWAGTFGGLSRLNPQNGKIYNFTVMDGLQSNQFYYNASLRLKTGELLFGGIKGFNLFNPQQIKISKFFPPLLVPEVKVLGKPVAMDNSYLSTDSPYDVKQITLPYDKSMFSLEVTALAYSQPEKIKYRYLLEGWDKGWNYSDNRIISYSRLNEGTYTLKINTTNSAGNWNTSSKEIKIVVLPPWYRTWWAYLIYVFVALTAVYLYVYYQRKQERLIYQIKLAKLEARQQQELNERRISFFTNISHEFRTPLTLIVNPIKDLLNNNGKNLNLFDISAVYRNTRRLLSLVDQLLLFRSTENEIADLKPEILDMVEVAHEVFLCFTNQVKTKQLNYTFETAVEKLENFADREKIEIVLFNIISNAIKYTPAKGTVSVALKVVKSNVEISVKDSGPGIDPQVGEKLFERFYRLNRTSSSGKENGFGVGLFVSKKIAEKQGGDISYSSKPGEGTTFTYTLAIVDAPVSKEAKAPKHAPTLLDELIVENLPLENPSRILEKNDLLYESITTDKAVILMVDDDGELRHYMREVLQDTYHVLECESAEVALDVLKSVDPDLILSDIVMPGMNGIDFCDKVKTSNKSYIPVILLTGTSSADIKLKGIECGADDYITKPFEKKLLLARIKSILKGRASLKKYFFNEITFQNNNESISEEYSKFLKKSIAIIERHLQDESFNVGVFVNEMEMSHSNVFRKVKSISGLSISEFIRHIRLKKAAELMIQSDVQIKQVAFMVGLNDVKYFRKEFVKLFGLTPSDYIKKYRKTFR